MEFLLWLKDVAERAVSSFVVAVLALLGAQGWDELFANGELNIAFVKTLATAGLVAAAVVIKQAGLPKSGFGLSATVEALYRAMWQGIQAGVAVFAADQFDWFDPTAWQGVGIVVIAALGSALKSFLADRFTTGTITPGSLASPPGGEVVAQAV
jgi:hypothetical protein